VKREKDRFFEGLAARCERRPIGPACRPTFELRPGHAAELIVRYATEVGAALIVLGYKGHFLRDHLLWFDSRPCLRALRLSGDDRPLGSFAWTRKGSAASFRG